MVIRHLIIHANPFCRNPLIGTAAVTCVPLTTINSSIACVALTTITQFIEPALTS
jgi:hypothetical protein